jgi:hypothetical protein
MTVIRKLSWESSNERGDIANPSPEQLEARLEWLAEGGEKSLFLTANNDDELMIGGDVELGFVACLWDGSNRCLLAPPHERDGKVELVLGFQPVEFPRKVVVRLPACVTAARTFFQLGEADPTVEWVAYERGE